MNAVLYYSRLDEEEIMNAKFYTCPGSKMSRSGSTKKKIKERNSSRHHYKVPGDQRTKIKTKRDLAAGSGDFKYQY